MSPRHTRDKTCETIETLKTRHGRHDMNVVVQTVYIIVYQHFYRIHTLDASMLNQIDEAHLQRASYTETLRKRRPKGCFVAWKSLVGIGDERHAMA